MAIVWAVTVKFRPYLYGGPTFTCRVDHNPLVYLHQQRNLTGRLARWHMRLMEYNFTVVHRAGLIHSNVDPLSRHPVCETPEDNWDDLPAYASFPVHALPADESPTVFAIEEPNTWTNPAHPPSQSLTRARDVSHLQRDREAATFNGLQQQQTRRGTPQSAAQMTTPTGENAATTTSANAPAPAHMAPRRENSAPRTKDPTPPTRTCYNCHKTGHVRPASPPTIAPKP